MQNNTGEATRFLNCIFRNCPDGSGDINLRRKDPDGTVHQNFISVDHIEDIPTILSNNNSSDWWFGVALRNGNDGTKKGISLIPAIHLDHDRLTPQIEEELRDFLKASAVVQTSSPSHKQCYWTFKEPIKGEDCRKVEIINYRLIKRFGGDSGTHDASRVLRIPGTVNYKYSDRPRCKLLELNPSIQYELSDFDILPEAHIPLESPGKLQIKDTPQAWEKAKREISRHARIMFHLMSPKPEDRSGHDWRLACLCVEGGITDPELLYQIILQNPHGKAQHYPGTNKYIEDLISRCMNQLNVSPAAGETIPNNNSFPEWIMGGVAGDFTHLYSQNIESPPVFLYLSFLCCLGSILAGRLNLKSERNFQTRLYLLLLGESANERKSTSIDTAVDFFRELFPNTLHTCWGVGSAEGLQSKINETPGGRVLLCADEFKALINKCRIEGSVLLPCLNTLFEKNYYESRTKNSDIKVNNAYLSLLAASTTATYENIWTSQFIDIGFPNRIFIVPGMGKKMFPLPQKIPFNKKQEIASKVSSIIQMVNEGLEIQITPEAESEYSRWYFSLAEENTIHTKRLDTYCLRFMPLLAINEKKDKVDLGIVKKAIALMDWQKKVREEFDPIDATNEVAKMEERIRRRLKQFPHTIGQLKHYTKISKDGIWVFNTAIKNLSEGVSREIEFNREEKKWQTI